VTIVTVPSRRETSLFLIVCDNCKTEVQVRDPEALPGAWRAFMPKGWAGDFHACSNGCEQRIRDRHEKKEGGPCDSE
jgi:hypothetical protein